MTNESGLVSEFRRRAEAVGAQVRGFATFAELRQAFEEWIAARPDATIAASTGALAQRLVTDTAIAESRLADTRDPRSLARCALGITGVRAAIAETGTLVLDASLERARLVSLLPEIHLAIVRSDQVVADLTEHFESLGSSPPAAITMITGPSRTADIELTLAIGVHGPRECWIWIVEDVHDLCADGSEVLKPESGE
ncbi:MAG: lactate utilization protein C [Planctomycetota bacterium]